MHPRNFRGRAAATAALVLLVSLAGCRVADEQVDFVWLLGAEPETLDPSLLSGQPGGRVARNIFEGLTYQDNDLRALPGMARSWDVSADGCSYTFHLRDAKWSDGRPVTAGDFVYSWVRTLEPATASRYANILYPVLNAQAFNEGKITDPGSVGVHAADDSTLVVQLHSPCAYFLGLCAFYTYLPEPRWVIEKYGDQWIKPEHIVTNGPFFLTQWILDRRVRLEKNPAYWNAGHIALQVTDGLTSDNINACFNLYMSGVLDWTDSGATPLFVIPELKRRSDFHVAPYYCSYFYRFNIKRKPFDDVRVRKAFFLATDRKAITDYVLRAGQVPAHSLVPPGVPGYHEVHLPDRNVAEARKLLAEAGYPGGKGFPHVEVLFNTSESHKQIAEVLQQQWKEALGVNVSLVNQEWKVFLATQNAEDYWISRGSWIGDYLDPNTFLDLWLSDNGNNRTGFENPDYDALIDRASRTLDNEKRMDLLHQAEEWVTNREMIVLPVYYYVVQNLYDDRDFTGLKPNLLNLLNLREVVPLRGHRGRPRDPHPAGSEAPVASAAAGGAAGTR